MTHAHIFAGYAWLHALTRAHTAGSVSTNAYVRKVCLAQDTAKLPRREGT
jgi:hypothetical protein